MIDLHLHFDGSLTDEVIIGLAERENIELPEKNSREFRDMFRLSGSCPGLNEYLDRFRLPLKLLQTPENLSWAMEKVCTELYRSGLLYAELRFAPQSHTERGMSQRQAVEAVLEGQSQAFRQWKKVSSSGWKPKTQVILCCMRGDNNELENKETLRLAKEYLGKGVAAADLAGAEALFPTENFHELFSGAAAEGLPFTIHAGEAAGAESIRAALNMGTKRIGHGIRAFEDPELVRSLKENHIPLECCPVSNQQTKAVRPGRAYPLMEYLKEGLCVTVNTDNMTVSDTCLDREFDFLSVQPEDKKNLLLNSVQASFLPENEKEALKEALLTELTIELF